MVFPTQRSIWIRSFSIVAPMTRKYVYMPSDTGGPHDDDDSDNDNNNNEEIDNDDK